MNKGISVAAIIFAIAALVTAITTAVVNFLSFKWMRNIYKPFEKVTEKSAPLMDKMLIYADKAMDEYIKDLED